jgi:hypothetical protein
MKLGRTEALILLLAIVLIAILSFALLQEGRDGPIREKTSSDPDGFLPIMGGIPPTGSVTGILGLDASLVDSRVNAEGSTPMLYSGGVFYRLYGDDEPLDLDELRSLGLELTEDHPFALVDLDIEPVQGESGPVEGSARVVSLEKVRDLDIDAAIAKLVSDFSNRTDELAMEIGYARLVLDPEMYNSVRTSVTCAHDGDGPMIVLDLQAGYEGPLEWYVVPYHLVLAAYRIDDGGEATEVTLVAPRVTSKVSKGLGIILLADTGKTRAGEEIRFMMALKNVGDVNYTAEAGPPLFDLNLYKKGGGSMGSWSTGKGFPEYVERITLQPGEVHRQTIMWDIMPLDPESGFPVQMVTGSYEVAAVWVPEDLDNDGLPIRINASRPSLSLSWKKSGGFAGVNEELTVSVEGDVLVTNRANLEKSSLRLSPDEHWNLFESLYDLDLKDLDGDEYRATGGAADYFSYELDIALGGSSVELRWVDHWACEVPLPGALIDAGGILEVLTKRVWADGAPMLE